MNARSRTLLATFAAVLLAEAVVFDASRLATFGTPQGEGPVISGPSYAPDGSEVAFRTDWRGPQQIWAVSTVNGRLRPIVAETKAVQLEPVWSPTGSWIAFASNRTGNYNIWLVRPDRAGLIQLTTARAKDDQPTWSPDGTQIAFVSDRAGPRNIWVVNADGSGLRRVTNLPCCQNHPSFSPDGSQIIFSQATFSKVGAGSTYVGSNLWIVNANGTGLRRLTTGAYNDSNPSWGARGILFDSDRPGPDIWMVQPDGSGLRAIPDVLGSKPTWSRDGTKFAFGSEGGIDEFNLLSGTIRPLLELKGYFIPIDIMPGVSSKVISLKEAGRIQVAIRAAPVGLPLLVGFDPVHELDQTSLTFGRTGDEESLDSCTVDGVNLVCNFKTALTDFRPGDTQGILRVSRVMPNGRMPLEGRGAVQVVP